MQINKPITIIVILAISFTVFFLFTLPKYRESQDLELDLVQKEAQYEARLDYYLKLADTTKKIEEMENANKKIENALPPSLDLAPIIFFLSQRAENAQLAVNSINFSEQKNVNQNIEQKFKNINFKVELSGSYQGLKTYLASLERSARLFEVTAISFTTANTESISKDNLPSYNFTVDVQTHTY